jgi:tetrahydromethanopterin S-methyltransferase subunit G
MQPSGVVSEASCAERRTHFKLTEEQLEDIAERAATRAVEKITTEVYANVGKAVVTRFIWLLGSLAIGIAIWAASKGYIKL